MTFPKLLKLRRTIDLYLAREYRGAARGARLDLMDWDGERWHHWPNAWVN